MCTREGVELIGKDEDAFAGVQLDVFAVDADGACGFEIEDEHESVMRAQFKCGAAKVGSGSSSKDEDVVGNACFRVGATVEVAPRRNKGASERLETCCHLVLLPVFKR